MAINSEINQQTLLRSVTINNRNQSTHLTQVSDYKQSKLINKPYLGQWLQTVEISFHNYVS